MSNPRARCPRTNVRRVVLQRAGENPVTALARSVIVADGLGHRSLA